MIGKRAFDCIAQESSSISTLVLRGRLPPCFMNKSVTLNNLIAKLKVFTAALYYDEEEV
jgi:hypothetical protein